MSLTSYRAAPPRAMMSCLGMPGLFVCRSSKALPSAVRRGLLHPARYCNTKGRFVSGLLTAFAVRIVLRRFKVAFCRPGSDLLSRVLRRSTMGAGAFHGRVRKGNGCSHPAITTRSAKRNFMFEKLGMRQ